MAKYRKKPIEIEAWQFDPSRPPTDAPSWVNFTWWHEEQVLYFDPNFQKVKHRRGSPCLMIPTAEGTMRANIGDWIIKGVKGEVYPCKPDIFAATYELSGGSERG